MATGSGMHGAVLFARDEPSLTAFVDSDGLQDSDEEGSPAWLDSELTGDFDGGFQTWYVLAGFSDICCSRVKPAAIFTSLGLGVRCYGSATRGTRPPCGLP